MPPTLLGWRERVDLPDLDVWNLEAKLDTGANVSTLHGRVAWGGSDPVLSSARLGLAPRPVPHAARRVVRSSNGIAEPRAVIRTTLRLAGRDISIRLSITDRSRMGTPLLIGREALAGFLVDPGRTYLATHTPSQPPEIRP